MFRFISLEVVLLFLFFFLFVLLHAWKIATFAGRAELGPRAAGTHKRIYHDHSREPAQHMATISNADDQVKQKQKNEGKKTPAERAFRGSSKSKSTEPETETELSRVRVRVIDREGEGSICCCC